jgi:hypothetical protein
MDVVVLDDDIADADADPEEDRHLQGIGGVALDEAALHVDREFGGAERAVEFEERPVAEEAEDAAEMRRCFRRDDVRAQAFDRGDCAGFVLAEEAAVTDDVGRDDRGKLAAHVCSPCNNTIIIAAGDGRKRP